MTERLVGSPPPAQVGSLANETLVIHRVQEKVGPAVALIGSMEPDSRNPVEQEEDSSLVESQTKDTEPVKWTDEKHSLYLNSMEASFVQQLQNSLNLLGGCSQKRSSSLSKSSDQKSTSKHNPSGQFKVFQDGHWAKINLSRGEPRLKKPDESGSVLSNPWIQHYRSGFREHTRTSTSSQEKNHLANIKEEFPAFQLRLRHQDSVGSSNTGSSDISLEGTDQNFTDEDLKNEKKSRTNKKRMKPSVVARPNHDQVVPFGKFSSTEDVAEHRIRSEE